MEAKGVVGTNIPLVGSPDEAEEPIGWIDDTDLGRVSTSPARQSRDAGELVDLVIPALRVSGDATRLLLGGNVSGAVVRLGFPDRRRPSGSPRLVHR